MKYFSFLILQIVTVGLLNAQDFDFDDGIYFEKPRYRDTTKHKYSLDNISYKLNSVRIYDYYYLDNDGTKKKFLHTKDESSKSNPLNLVPYNNNIYHAIDKIKIIVDDNNKLFSQHDSDYTQTVISYLFLLKNGKSSDTIWAEYKDKHPELTFADESTGVVDNKMNLWIHPPRTLTFKILQLNPFPFYCLDENVKTWSWNLGTGGGYLDPRWVKQQDKLTIHYNYKRQPDETIETSLGKLKCKVTFATASTDLKDIPINTSLKSYYYPEYGFVRLEYTNVNGTKLVMQLIDAK